MESACGSTGFYFLVRLSCFSAECSLSRFSYSITELFYFACAFLDA